MQFHDTDIGSHLSDSRSPSHPHRISLDLVPNTRIPGLSAGPFVFLTADRTLRDFPQHCLHAPEQHHTDRKAVLKTVTSHTKRDTQEIIMGGTADLTAKSNHPCTDRHIHLDGCNAHTLPLAVTSILSPSFTSFADAYVWSSFKLLLAALSSFIFVFIRRPSKKPRFFPVLASCCEQATHLQKYGYLPRCNSIHHMETFGATPISPSNRDQR
ncbi:uncharacterized protein BDZ83DRAFT_639769 [Colletotrichum acutatum]|uniref:Uncharacterized protein n=1 Tax=Glomerella acutata TaxID=27357 RepID=A0AAD8X937_GLOAC|nr:uncharacterized protein BDZ83DRAFT_639769 [Colletotrichum acutatum]KAK1711231.1 hypothetical protein BDZ83DRAFT_639769 [Colletotrichum acutatum]